MKISWIGASLLFLVLVILTGFHGTWLQAFLSLGLIIFLCLTALPISRILFPDQVEAMILTFPVGYVLHAFLLSFAGLFFGIDRLTIIIYIAIVILLMVFWKFRISGKTDQATVSTSWKREDWMLMFLWLFLTVAIVALPFARVGEEAGGGYTYRAYFNADFFRNMAVSGSLSHAGIPPDNPYLGGHKLHYYWFFHLIPAYWNELFPSYRSDFVMVQFSLVAMLIFTAALFVVLRRFVQHRKSALFLLPVFAVGGSYEGLYVLQWLRNRQQPWTEFVNLNIDGILRWHWKAPQIDTLYRALLYAPQHLIALAIFLMALLIWNSERSGQEPLKGGNRKVIFYFLIFASLGFSAFIGATLILGAACILLFQTFRDPGKKWREVLFSGLFGISFLALYLFCFQMFQPGSQQIEFGPDKTILAHFPQYFLLNWGALLVIGLAGVFYRSPLLPNRILLFFLLFCFLLIVFVRILLAGLSDISLKVGHFSHVVLLLLAAGALDRFLGAHPQKSKWLAALITLLVLPAMVTWGMDAWNSSDIRNRRFTTHIKKEEAEVCRWMRSNLPEKTVVLNYSPRYEDFMQDIIPPFAERSVFLGNRIFSRIFQVEEKSVQNRSKVVSTFLRLSSPKESWTLARKAGIQYVFVSDIQTARMPELLLKLSSPYFSLLMQDGETALFRVNENPQ